MSICKYLGKEDTMNQTNEVSNKIFTIPNVISFVRLCLIPVYLVLLLDDHNALATFIFALAASTDFLDGQIARRTNSVSRLGQILDPTVDRLLMITGVVGLLIVGRLPLWVIVFVIARDAYLLLGGAYILVRYRVRVPVIYVGKVATTFLFVGFAGILLNFPLIQGIGITNLDFFPGLNAQFCSWGIWFVYIGLILALFTTIYYSVAAWRAIKKARGGREEAENSSRSEINKDTLKELMDYTLSSGDGKNANS